MPAKKLHRVNTEATDDSVCPGSVCVYVSVCMCVCCVCVSVTSFLLQQGGNVDVPADGLPVEATGEEVTRLVLLIPRCTTNHTPVTHPVAARKSGQPHSVHVEQSDLSIVVWQSDDPLVSRDADPVHS